MKLAAKILTATYVALQGLKTAISKHYAFKIELAATLILTTLLCLVSLPIVYKIILEACLVMVLIVELINSAIETTIDRFSLDTHPLSKEAKDLASAAVLMAIILNAVAWLYLFCLPLLLK